MAKKRVSLFFDSESYNEFKEGFDKCSIVSKQFQNYMEKEVKRG